MCRPCRWGGLNVNEGDSANLKVQLNTQPTGDVTVTISVPADADVTLSPESLTFTTDNWNTQKTVTVTAMEDTDGYDDKVTLSLSAADGGYDGVSKDYVVTIVDDDLPVGVITGVFPSNVLMNEAKVSLNIWEARPRTRLHWRYQAVGDSDWTDGASPKYTNLTNGGTVTSETFTFASRHTIHLTGLTAGKTYEIQFALTGDNRTTNNEPPDFSVGSATKQFSTTSRVIEISISDAASIADEGHGLVFRLNRHHAGSYPPGLTVNYRLEVYKYLAGGVATTAESTTTGTTFFGHRDYTGGLTIPTTHDNQCGNQLYARYYKVTLLDGNGYTAKAGGTLLNLGGRNHHRHRPPNHHLQLGSGRRRLEDRRRGPRHGSHGGADRAGGTRWAPCANMVACGSGPCPTRTPATSCAATTTASGSRWAR